MSWILFGVVVLKAWNKAALGLAAALVMCLAVALVWSFVAVIFLIV